MRYKTAIALIFVTFGAAAQQKAPQTPPIASDTANPPVVSPEEAQSVRFAVENFCLTTGRLAEKVAIMRDLGAPEHRVLKFVLKDESNEELRKFSTREVRWIYTNTLVEPSLARQVRYTSCMANPPY